jgi:two-component sensor histidine kinase
MSALTDHPADTAPPPRPVRVGRAADGWSEAGAAPHLLAGPAGIEALRHGLAPPLAGFLDTGGGGLDGVGPRCPATVAAGGLVLSLTTAAVCALPVVELMTGAIRHRFGLPPGDLIERIEICLAEALGNAVIHGNLAIPGHLRTSPCGFARFRQMMAERLRDPMLADRRVEIHALRAATNSFTLLVSDQGSGFDLGGQAGRAVPIDARCGRGLDLIRRGCTGLAGEDGGRTLRMEFAGPEADRPAREGERG